jgi:signal transduction histidine kinase
MHVRPTFLQRIVGAARVAEESRLSTWLASRPLALLLALDAGIVAAIAAAFLRLDGEDIVFLVAFALVAIESVAFSVRAAAPRMILALGASALNTVTPGGMPLDEVLLEWPLMLVIGGIFAMILSARRNALVRRYVGLYRMASDRLLITQEFERRRVSHDLHEEVGQTLTALTSRLEAMIAGLPPDDPVRANLEGCRDLASDAVAASRDLAERVRPTRLTENGLVVALRDLAAKAGLPVSLDVDPGLGTLRDLEADVVVGIFRIVQEAVWNVVRHSGGHRAWIELTEDDDTLRVRVGDDGSGFDVDAASEEGLGLAGMRERGAMLRGSVTITSAPGAGTIVDLRVPRTGMSHWRPMPPEDSRRLASAKGAGEAPWPRSNLASG